MQNYSDHNVATTRAPSALQTNKVLRSTYMLLSMTLLFSAFTAFLNMQMGIVFPPLLTIGAYFVLLFVTTKLRNSVWGIASVFALTGLLGFTLGPMLSYYLQAIPNGGELIMLALGGTGIIFLAMSGIAMTSKRDFSGMAKFLFVGILVAFIAAMANIFLQIPALSLAISSMFMVLSSLLILWQTQQIVNGGETNYIMATVTLFVSLYNIFASLLHILGVFGGDD